MLFSCLNDRFFLVIANACSTVAQTGKHQPARRREDRDHRTAARSVLATFLQPRQVRFFEPFNDGQPHVLREMNAFRNVFVQIIPHELCTAGPVSAIEQGKKH